jgi:hypothetical protein
MSRNNSYDCIIQRFSRLFIVGSRKLNLKCPAGAQPGRSLAITVPVEKPDENKMNEFNGPNVKYIPDSDPPGKHIKAVFCIIIAKTHHDITSYFISLHGDNSPKYSWRNEVCCIGKFFHPRMRVVMHMIQDKKAHKSMDSTFQINGDNLMVTSPPNALPGMSLRVVPPGSKIPRQKRKVGQKFEVQIPDHIKPGESFPLIANGIRVLVECPMNAKAGQMVRFHLPFRTEGTDVKKLTYDVDGWARTLQVAQMKFQWYVMSATFLEKVLHQFFMLY